MLVERVVGRWRVVADVEATQQAYAKISLGSPEECGCQHCRNFAQARELVYGPQVRAVLESVGVDPRKEAEIYHIVEVRPGVHSYGGWFHFVGSILTGADCWEPAGDNLCTASLDSVGPGFELGFTSRLDLVRAAFGQQSLCQVEFAADVPWVLSEPFADWGAL